MRLTKESPVCRPELRLGSSWCDPENLVVRADGSQLAPSLAAIDNVNPVRGLTGSLRLVARGDKPTSREGSGGQKEP